MSTHITIQAEGGNLADLEKIQDALKKIGVVGLRIVDPNLAHPYSQIASSPESIIAADEWRDAQIEKMRLISFDEAHPLAPFMSENGFTEQGPGVSAMTIFNFFRADPQISNERDAFPAHPYDLEDFKRCLELFDVVPEWRTRINELSILSPAWASLVSEWSNVENAYQADDLEQASSIIQRCLEGV